VVDVRHAADTFVIGFAAPALPPLFKYVP